MVLGAAQLLILDNLIVMSLFYGDMVGTLAVGKF